MDETPSSSKVKPKRSATISAGHRRFLLVSCKKIKNFGKANLASSFNLARVDSSSPLCWSQAQEKREGWKPHFCKTTHTQNPQRNTTHRHQPRNSDLFKFFRGRTPGLIAWAVAMNKPG
nr:unnamed protein product [Callosobruchus chinensis]